MPCVGNVGVIALWRYPSFPDHITPSGRAFEGGERPRPQRCEGGVQRFLRYCVPIPEPEIRLAGGFGNSDVDEIADAVCSFRERPLHLPD
jgi:hypothetical protein